MSSLWVIGIVILIAGVAGGLRNWLSSADDLAPRAFWARLLESTIAAATVPLFLSIIGNEKVNAAFGEIDFLNSEYQSSLLIFIGFGLLASVYSRKFLDSISVQILTDKISKVEDDVEKTRDIAEAAVEGAMETEVTQNSLPEHERQLLAALVEGSFAIRSVEGLAKSSSLEREVVERALEDLEKKALVKSLPTSKGTRWAVTDGGRALAS